MEVWRRLGQLLPERTFPLHRSRIPRDFAPDTPPTFAFPTPDAPNAGQRPDLEQSAFVQDLIHLDNWTISAGLRWDHYQLLLNQKLSARALPFRAISRRPIWFCISPMIAFFRLRRSTTFCFRVRHRVAALSPTRFCGCPSKPSVGQLLRSWANQILLRTIQARCELLSQARQQLCR